MKKLLFAALALLTLTVHGQNCVINLIQNPSFNNSAPLFSLMGTQVPNWSVLSGTPDIYPNGTIFMWGTSEGIFQDLCEPLVAGQQYDFSIDAYTTARNFGTMEIEFTMSGGGTIQTVLSTAMVNTTFLTFNTSFTAGDNYDRIRIRPLGSGGVMDIVVDNVLVEETIAISGTTQHLILNCCEDQTLTISDPGFAYDEIEWYEAGAGSPFATGTSSVVLKPEPPQSTYFVYKKVIRCTGECTVIDTIIVDCIDLWSLPSGPAAKTGKAKSYRPSSTAGHEEHTAVLYQNIPNPFSEVTTIRYSLPDDGGDAILLVFDMKGKQLKRYALSQRGTGSVNIGSGELLPGMYIYSLVIDGQEVDTKRMILLER